MGQGVSYFVILVLIMACFWIFTLWKGSRRLNQEIKHVAQQHNLIRHDDRVLRLCRAIHLINPHVSAGIDYMISHDDPGQDPVIAAWTTDTPRPTDAQIRSALEEVSRAHHEEEYAARRRAEYPSIGEQLEAAYEARQGNPAMQQAVDEKIRQVREKYPKSEVCL
jgi:hypothetical protein